MPLSNQKAFAKASAFFLFRAFIFPYFLFSLPLSFFCTGVLFDFGAKGAPHARMKGAKGKIACGAFFAADFTQKGERRCKSDACRRGEKRGRRQKIRKGGVGRRDGRRKNVEKFLKRGVKRLTREGGVRCILYLSGGMPARANSERKNFSGGTEQ